MDTALTQKFPFILDRNLAKANCTENHVCTSCDTVVLGFYEEAGRVATVVFFCDNMRLRDFKWAYKMAQEGFTGLGGSLLLIKLAHGLFCRAGSSRPFNLKQTLLG